MVNLPLFGMPLIMSDMLLLLLASLLPVPLPARGVP